MTNTLTDAINLKKVEASKKTVADWKKAQRDKVVEILSRPLLPSEQEKVYQELERYVKMNFAYDLTRRFNYINNGIFDLKRDWEVDIQTGYSKGIYRITAPSLVKIPLNEKNEGIYKTRVTGRNTKNSEETQIDISCSIPEITQEAKAEYTKALAISAGLVSRSYRDELISKILSRDTSKKIETPLDSKYFLVWAPSIWDSKVVERDPAIFMNYNGWNFLVHQWDVPQERSLDALLREFKEHLG